MEQPDSARALPTGEAGRLAAFLRKGGRIAVLTGPARAATREVLEAALRSVPGLVIRTGNPLSTPLSLSRLLLQAGADPHADDEAAALLDSMSVHAGGRTGAVLAIDDAHTLEPDALAVLRQLPMPGTEGRLGVQLVFAGRAGLMERLAEAGFAGLDDVAASLVLRVESGDAEATAAPPTPRPRAVGSVPPIPPPPPPLVKPVRTPTPGRPEPGPAGALPGVLPGFGGGPGVAALERPGRLPEPTGGARAVAPAAARRRRPLLVAALAGSTVGVMVGVAGLWMLGKLGLPDLGLAAAPAAAGLAPVPDAGGAANSAGGPAATPVVPPAAVPAPAVPAIEPPAVLSNPQGGLPPGTDESRLRRDFDAFLRRNGWNGAARTPEAREALFQDYKDWLARNRAGPAPTLH